MRTETQNLVQELTAFGKSTLTIQRYSWLSESYLREAGEDPWSRQAVNSFLARMTGKNYRRWAYTVIRRLFEVNEQKWPFGKGLPERPTAREVRAPVLPAGDVRRAIENRHRLEGWEAGHLALSAIYGVRQEEILLVRPEDLGDGTIFIHTVKHGDQRTHILPDRVKPLIEAWANLEERPAKSTLFSHFHHIMGVCGVKTEPGMGWHCVPPRTLVITDEGCVPIEQIQVGQKVWGKGHTSGSGLVCGKFSPVVATFAHEYSGDLVKIKAHGLLPILATANHPFLVKKWHGAHHVVRKLHDRRNISFIEAGCLNKGDCLIVPKLSKDGVVQSIDFSPYVKKHGWGKLQHLRQGMLVDEEVAEFLGRYLADGAGSKGGNHLYFSHDEIKEMDRFTSIIEQRLRLKVRRDILKSICIIKGRRTTGSCWHLQFGGEVLRRFLQDKIKVTARSAKVPEFIFNSPPEVVTAFLKGYFEGDGYICWKRGSIDASTVSKELALQIQLLFTKIGVWANLRNSPSDQSRYHISVSKSEAEGFIKGNTITKTKGSPIFEDRNHYYCPITAIEHLPYSGTVHNLETKQKNYCINNAICHNSVRRSLITELQLAGYSEFFIYRFLRWRMSSSPFGMLPVYSHIPEAVLDKYIFSRHPFLEGFGVDRTVYSTDPEVRGLLERLRG